MPRSTPSSENPIIANALRLIELRGRASPIFISLQVQRIPHSRASYSENMIFAFKQYERNNRGVVSLQVFTAISPRKLMHEDTFTLALNVLASIIILTFHRRWVIDESVEYDDVSLRALNSNVQDRAPCSIGVLVDKAHAGPSSATRYSVSVIFLDGNDCQEVLSLVKRMIKHGNISRAKAKNPNYEAKMECINALYDFKQNRRIGQGNVNVTHVEKLVNDS